MIESEQSGAEGTEVWDRAQRDWLQAQGLPRVALRTGRTTFMHYAYYKDELAGINEYHLDRNGRLCTGWVPFADTEWSRSFDKVAGYAAWEVRVAPPRLTLAPSILCRICGNHGYIEDGRWRAA